MLTAVGCKSYWIDASVENQTGETIHELEVGYPTASFGTNALAQGAVMHYRLQIRGSGPVKVEYTRADGTIAKMQGLALAEREQGDVKIRLLPAGKADFVMNLKPAS
jgi:hypothetical protein